MIVSPRVFFRPHRIGLLVALLASLAFPAAAPAAQPDQDAVREAVRQILKENPELVLDILKDNSETVLEIAQQGNTLRKRKITLAQWDMDARQAKTIELQGRVFRGPDTAPVTIVAYSDFTCPYCRQAEHVVSEILRKYNDKVRLTFKALPKDDSYSQAAAKLVTAAFMADPAKGWELHDALFAGLERLEREGEGFLQEATAGAGFDFKKLKAAAAAADVQARLDADRKEADTYGISGTPYFLVNDLLVRGAIGQDLFEEAVDRALALKGAKK
jgi:protein-disulfide isomerase